LLKVPFAGKLTEEIVNCVKSTDKTYSYVPLHIFITELYLHGDMLYVTVSGKKGSRSLLAFDLK
jgi:hypothetical protein